MYRKSGQDVDPGHRGFEEEKHKRLPSLDWDGVHAQLLPVRPRLPAPVDQSANLWKRRDQKASGTNRVTNTAL